MEGPVSMTPRGVGAYDQLMASGWTPHRHIVRHLLRDKGVPGQNAHNGNNGKSRDIIAGYVGISGTTLEKVEAVVKAAEENPDKYGHLKERMDQTGKVNQQYQQLRFRR